MALKGDDGIIARHALAVIYDADQSLTARFNFNIDFSGSRVESIFQQFFDDRCRALDNLARSNFVSERIRKHCASANAADERQRGGVMSLLYNEQRPVDPLGDADAENEKQVKHNRARVGSSRPFRST